MEAIIPRNVPIDTPEVCFTDSLCISQPSEDDSQNRLSHHTLPHDLQIHQCWSPALIKNRTLGMAGCEKTYVTSIQFSVKAKSFICGPSLLPRVHQGERRKEGRVLLGSLSPLESFP